MHQAIVGAALVGVLAACSGGGGAPAPEICTPQGANTILTASPDTGTLAPDVLVHTDRDVQLFAHAAIYFECVRIEGGRRRFLRIEERPLPYDWSLVHYPRGGLPADAAAELRPPSGSDTPTFHAGSGFYVASIKVRPQPGLNLHIDRTILIETADTDGWVTVGPFGRLPDGAGRVNDIAFEPGRANVMFAAANRGGLFRSDDAGLFWYPMSDRKAVAPDKEWFSTMATGRVLALASGRLLVATGDPDLEPGGDNPAIYVSDDGGVTWHTGLPAGQCPPNQRSRPGNRVLRMARSPVNDHVFVASYSGVFRSVDGGDCWQSIPLPANLKGLNGQRVDDLAVMVDQGKTHLFVVPSFDRQAKVIPIGRTVVGTLDADADPVVWSQTPAVPPVDRPITPLPVPLGNIRLAASDAALYAVVPILTKDIDIWVYRADPSPGGLPVWQPPGDPDVWCGGGQCEGYDLAIAVDPHNPLDVSVGALDVFHSADGGKTWASISWSHVDHHAMIYDPIRPGRLWVGNDGGIAFRDLAATGPLGPWTTRTAGLSTMEEYGQELAPWDATSTAMVIGLQDNGVIRRVAGRVWAGVEGNDGAEPGFDAVDRNAIYSVTLDFSPNVPRAVIARGPAVIGRAQTFYYDPDTSGVLLGVGPAGKPNAGELYRATGAATAGSLTWSCADGTPADPKDSVTSVAFGADGNYYVGTSLGWVWRVKPGDLRGSATCSNFDSQDDPVFFARAWTPIGGSTGEVTGIALDPADGGQSMFVTLARVDEWRIVFLHREANGSFTPTPLAQTFPHDTTTSAGILGFVGPIAVDPTDTSRVYLGTGSGLFVGGRDPGGDWKQVPNFPAVWVDALERRPGRACDRTGTLRAGTYGRSVWERVFPAHAPSCPGGTGAGTASLTALLLGPPDGPPATQIAIAVDYDYDGSRGPLVLTPAAFSGERPVGSLTAHTARIEQGHGRAIVWLADLAGEGQPTVEAQEIRVAARPEKGPEEIVSRASLTGPFRWHRANTASLLVHAELQVPGGPVPLPPRLVGEGPTRTATRGTTVPVEALERIDTPRGPAIFMDWIVPGATEPPVWLTDATRPHLDIPLDEDLVLTARYRLSAQR